MTHPLAIQNKWYHEGLRFKCTECGQCCTGSPGYIWVTLEEIEAIAAHLNISLEEFSIRYLRKVGEKWSLQEYPKTWDCVFLKDKKCSIYSVRPIQCRTFPWWPSQLQSPEAWHQASQHCEGIHLEAPLVPYEEIQKNLGEMKRDDKQTFSQP